jgi:hypothetical protein
MYIYNIYNIYIYHTLQSEWNTFMKPETRLPRAGKETTARQPTSGCGPYPKSKSRVPKPETRDLKPEARNPKPASLKGNDGPATNEWVRARIPTPCILNGILSLNPRPETRDPGPESRSARAGKARRPGDKTSGTGPTRHPNPGI